MTVHGVAGDEALADLAAAIGDELALKLASHFGGTRQYVPRAIGEHHPLAVVLGSEGASRLATWAGGGSIDVPKQAARRQKVRLLRSRGALTIAQIAMETSYTERHVYRLLQAHRDDAQPGLFDNLP
jgi:hypothetical protein